MSSKQAAAMLEHLHSTCHALAQMQQELTNQAITTWKHHQEALQQTVATVQHTHKLTEHTESSTIIPFSDSQRILRITTIWKLGRITHCFAYHDNCPLLIYCINHHQKTAIPLRLIHPKEPTQMVQFMSGNDPSPVDDRRTSFDIQISPCKYDSTNTLANLSNPILPILR